MIRLRPATVTAAWRRVLSLALAAAAGACGSGERSTVPPDTSTGAAVAATSAGDLDTSSAGFASVALVEKDDRSFKAIPARPGGAGGTFWYRVAASPATGMRELRWRVEAHGLDPERAYRVEMHADDGFYSVASLRSDSAGTLRGGGTLDRFEDGTCVGADQSRPRPITDAHTLGVAIKTDGAPNSGAQRSRSPTAAGGTELPCTGNGDGVFDYRLFEAAPIPLGGPS